MSGPPRKGALSNGTLSLKFMQRGAPSDSGKVTLTKAKVKDEGEWEIAQEVREAWGVGGESNQNVTYEQSYLPFLLPVLANRKPTPSSLPDGGGGRRSFGKFNKSLEPRGPDEPAEDMKDPSLTAAPAAGPSGSQPAEQPETRRNPRAISDVNARQPPPFAVSGFRQPEPVSAFPHHAPGPSSSGFQRPAGVDSPRGTPSSKDQEKRKREHAFPSGGGALPPEKKRKKQRKEKNGVMPSDE